MNNREQKRNRLMDAIGNVDDRFLNEALSYCPRKRMGPHALLLAACLTVAAVLVVQCLVIFSTVKRGNSNVDELPANTLDTVLLAGTGKAETKGDVDELFQGILFDSKPRLVWQTSESDTLYVSRSLTENEVKTLVSEISKGKPVGVESPSQSCRVWLTLGNGTVLTPYLPTADGNMGITLFAYEAELIPTASLVRTVSGLLA